MKRLRGNDLKKKKNYRTRRHEQSRFKQNVVRIYMHLCKIEQHFDLYIGQTTARKIDFDFFR